ncbi:uncharacterized protein LOC123429549 [Hordeum vulgare subsp. vulgare]|uniref:uncharacterized protein LOC123429549 n=1 Tax=Hordeum vulgare subsp. vulgare TaxID=112509 RepID=UPI001D1A4CAB|nr:uncharacterized protein LOC123429549 [Hordeum vulgare subsp. vulgare]
MGLQHTTVWLFHRSPQAWESPTASPWGSRPLCGSMPAPEPEQSTTPVANTTPHTREPPAVRDDMEALAKAACTAIPRGPQHWTTEEAEPVLVAQVKPSPETLELGVRQEEHQRRGPAGDPHPELRRRPQRPSSAAQQDPQEPLRTGER